MKLICPDCGMQYDSGKFCQECGTKLQEVAPELVCPSCGYKAKSGKFCPECGTKLTEQKPATETSAPAETPKRTFNERDPRFAKYYDKKGFPRTIPQEEREVAKEELAPYVEQGVAEAKMLLANILLEESNKTGNEESCLEAIRLLQEAEADGDELAYFMMGGVYIIKNDSAKFDDAEKRLLELMNRYNDAEPAGMLAHFYAHYEEKRDYQKAFKYATIAAEEDDDKGYQVLGVLYHLGLGVEKDLDKALENYTQAAALGDIESMVMIGNIYLGEDGGEPNPEQAFYWFNEAAKKGSNDGMYCLGCCYRDGFGVEADAETAAEWFKKSADLGDVSSMTELGKYYQTTLYDDKKAKKWFTKAAELGDAEAQSELIILYACNLEPNYDEALKWCHKAMEQDNAWAYRIYAEFLWDGNGCEKDKEKAMEMMRKAASLGLSDAEAELEEMKQAIADEEKQLKKSKAPSQKAKTEEAKNLTSSNELHIPEDVERIDCLVGLGPKKSKKDWKSKIEVLFLPNNIEHISASVLQELPNLKRIVIPDNQFNKIGKMLPSAQWMMYYRDGSSACPEITTPSPKAKTEEAKNLTPSNELHIPEDVERIDCLVGLEPKKSKKDWKSKIEVLFLPDSIKYISASVLPELPNLKRIVIPDYQFDKIGKMLPWAWWMMYYRDGSSACPEITIPKGELWVLPYGETTVKNTSGAKGHVLIPPTCSEIAKGAFEFNNNILSVTMTDGVTSIGKGAFASCKNLQFIRLSTSLRTIPKSMVEFCNSLKEIEIPARVTSIEQAAFASCKSLEKVILPSTVNKIDRGGTWGSNPFQYSNFLKEIVVPTGTITKFRRLLYDFSGNPAKLLVEMKVKEPKKVKSPTKIVVKSTGLPMDEIIKAANASYKKQSLKDIAVATLKIAEVIQERLPEEDVSYLVRPADIDHSADQDALPVHFLFKNNGIPRVAVMVVTENGYRTFRVKETQDWCERNGIKFVRVYADGYYADWITGRSKHTNAPVSPKSVEFCKNWLVEKISNYL